MTAARSAPLSTMGATNCREIFSPPATAPHPAANWLSLSAIGVNKFFEFGRSAARRCISRGSDAVSKALSLAFSTSLLMAGLISADKLSIRVHSSSRFWANVCIVCTREWRNLSSPCDFRPDISSIICIVPCHDVLCRLIARRDSAPRGWDERLSTVRSFLYAGDRHP